VASSCRSSTLPLSSVNDGSLPANISEWCPAELRHLQKFPLHFWSTHAHVSFASVENSVEFSYVCYWKGFWGMSSNCFRKEKLPTCSAMLVTNFSINWIYVESCFYFPQMPQKMTEFVLNYMFENIKLFLKRTNSFLLLLVVVTKSRVVYFSPCSFTFKLLRCHTTSGIRNLWLVSQMWLFWRRHLARLIFS